uniref:Uncharacterized protein n=1 Tax=Oryza barthii TaxID=65489 RepID=A0A0D3GLX9_9ORYZ
MAPARPGRREERPRLASSLAANQQSLPAAAGAMPDGDALVGGGRRRRSGGCMGFLRLRLVSVGVNSGSGMSPLRYSMTWFILGLDLENGCEHKSPSFSTRHASSMLQFPCSLLSIVSTIDPFCQCSSTQSTNINRSPCAFCLTGLCPQVISRRNVPNANTSVRGDGLPVRTNSGARFSHFDGSQGYINLCGSCIILNPHLHHVTANERQVLEHAIFVIIEASIPGLHRVETINVDANMVVTDVLEFTVLDGVKLNCEDMVACIAVVLRVGETLVCGDKEGHAICTFVRNSREDAEDEEDWSSSYLVKCKQILRSHLPDKMSGVIVPKLFPDHGYCATYGSNPSLCIIASKLEFRVAGVNSGSGASPSRYCMTCRMIGLAPGIGCEHISPSVNTRHASSTL